MNKILLSFILIFAVNVILPSKYNTSANAGVITWGAKKLIIVTIKLIFKVSSKKLIDIQIKKLTQFIVKNPKYKQYAIDKIKEQIKKYPKYSKRGYILLDNILRLTHKKYGI